MAVSNKFALQRVFTAKIFDLETGENIGIFEDLKDSSFNQEGTVVYTQGGAGNAKIIGFDHSKMAKFSLNNATFDFNAFGAIVGSTPVTGTNTDYVYTDTLTVNSNATTTTYTALGTAGSEIKYAYIKNTDGSLGTKYTQDSLAGAGKFTYNPGTKAVTFNTGDITNGTEIIVFYNATAGATTRTVSSYTDLFAKNVKLVADGLARDICTGEDYGCQIIFYKAKVSNNIEFALSSAGDPAVQPIEVEALKSCGSTKLWDMIVFEDDQIS